jgi:hypothetical protein
MSERGMNTVPPAATAPSGPGHAISTWSTATAKAIEAAITEPMANHCNRSRSCPTAVA